MSELSKTAIAGAVVLLAISLMFVARAQNTTEYVFIKEKPTLSYRQQAWVGALEWCESRATVAVNPKDRDGTPSYYYFQFKPDTFKAYGEKYHVIDGLEGDIMELMKSALLQHRILEGMIKDKKNINWSNEFPICVKRLGPPPD